MKTNDLTVTVELQSELFSVKKMSEFKMKLLMEKGLFKLFVVLRVWKKYIVSVLWFNPAGS